MARKMYDSTNPLDIPRTALIVAGYTDGLYAWSKSGWDFHGGARQVRICAVSLDMTAHVADIENGALTPAQGALFVKQKMARGQHPSLYFSTSKLDAVLQALLALGIGHRDHWSWWAALWDGKFEAYPGAVAKQYANPTISGAHYDLSWVADYWPGVDPAPKPAPAPVPAPVPVPVPGPPPVVSPPTPAPAPAPPDGPPIDQTRSAWASLAAFFTESLPATIRELLRLLGITRNL